MDKTNSHFFYVLECADKSYYAGYTTNVEKRVAAHNAGKVPNIHGLEGRLNVFMSKLSTQNKKRCGQNMLLSS